jgi:dTDP-4-dehydrorhamnose reductase
VKVLIFGVSGMLGHALYQELKKNHEVLGVSRSNKWHQDIISGVSIEDLDKVEKIVQESRPDFILNAVGIIKQVDESKDKQVNIKANALWPHQLCEIAGQYGAKVVHFSTDCVFTGTKGHYKEEDLADSRDTYGLTKYLGEVDYPHALTLRTSIIGHELASNVSLIDWFLTQKGNVKGFKHAIYSGFPTVVVARFLNEYVFNNWFSGVYHLSSEPISKFDLLKLVAEVYGKNIEILPNTDFKMDRSLDSSRLQEKTSFKPAPWRELVEEMHGFYIENKQLYNKDIG